MEIWTLQALFERPDKNPRNPTADLHLQLPVTTLMKSNVLRDGSPGLRPKHAASIDVEVNDTHLYLIASGEICGTCMILLRVLRTLQAQRPFLLGKVSAPVVEPIRTLFSSHRAQMAHTTLPPLLAEPPKTYIQPIISQSCGGRVRIAALMDAADSDSFLGKHVAVCGWSRSVRKQGGGKLCFVVLTDGSTSTNLQVVVESSVENFEELLKCGAGCSFRFCGQVVESPAKGQKVELQVKDPERGGVFVPTVVV